ncbi:hypothetical protein GCM10027168_45540 [Streptomyces capparidis]
MGHSYDDPGGGEQELARLALDYRTLAPAGPPPEVAQALRRLLREHRARTSLAAAHGRSRELGLAPPGLESMPGAKAGIGITQEQLALLLFVSDRAYQAWERGAVAIPADQVDVLATVLGMTDNDRVHLHRLARRHDPQPVPGPPRQELLDPGWRIKVRLERFPAYLSTLGWTVLEANGAYYEFFPFVREEEPHNIARTTLLHPMARKVLVHWERDWATPMLRHLWSLYQLHPGDNEISTLIRQVAESPQTRDIWKSRAAASRVFYPDTLIRLMRHPRLGPIRVTSLYATPESLKPYGYRFINLLPLDQLPRELLPADLARALDTGLPDPDGS